MQKHCIMEEFVIFALNLLTIVCAAPTYSNRTAYSNETVYSNGTAYLNGTAYSNGTTVLDCSNNRSSIVSFPHSSNCSKYYQCADGTQVEMTCPMGQHYNTRLKVCDDQKYAGCKLNERLNLTITKMPPLLHNFSENESTEQLNSTTIIPMNTNRTQIQTSSRVPTHYKLTSSAPDVTNHYTVGNNLMNSTANLVQSGLTSTVNMLTHNLNSTMTGTRNDHVNTATSDIASTNMSIVTTTKPLNQSTTQFQTQNTPGKVEVTNAQDIKISTDTDDKDSEGEESDDENENTETETKKP